MLEHEDHGMMAIIQVLPSNHAHDKNYIQSLIFGSSEGQKVWTPLAIGIIVFATVIILALAGYIVSQKFAAIKTLAESKNSWWDRLFKKWYEAALSGKSAPASVNPNQIELGQARAK